MATVSADFAALSHLLAQTNQDGIFPEDSGARIIFAIVVLVMLGLYLLIRRTHRRTNQAYWQRQREAENRRKNDPDMRIED